MAGDEQEAELIQKLYAFVRRVAERPTARIDSYYANGQSFTTVSNPFYDEARALVNELDEAQGIS